MKYLITMLFLLPALAHAVGDCPPWVIAPTCTDLSITSGSMGGGGFVASGPGFTTMGSGAFSEAIGGTNLIHLGDSYFVNANDATSATLITSLTVDGTRFYPGSPAFAGGAIVSTIATVGPITGAGLYSTGFGFSESFLGSPVQGAPCFDGCNGFQISGSGTAVFDVVAQPFIPNTFYISKLTYTFTAPEPATASLLLLGFAGLAVFGSCRRKGRQV